MSRRSQKYERAAHIKRHTVGTSNEISFDVLDAARAELEGDSKKIRKSSGIMPGIPVPALNFGPGSKQNAPTDESLGLGTPETVTPTRDMSSTSPERRTSKRKREKREKKRPKVQEAPVQHRVLTPEETEREIERRKTRRRKHRRHIRFLVVLIVVVAICAGGVTLFSYLQAEQTKTARINAFIESLTEVDSSLTQIDEAIADPLDAVTTGTWKTLKPSVEQQLSLLQSCLVDARAMGNEFYNQETKDLLKHIEACATQRVAMLTAAQSMFKEAEAAQRALDEANGAWLVLVDADNLAREASSLLSSASADSTIDNTVKESMAKSEDALARFNEAQEELVEAEQSYEGVDLQVYIDYAQARAEAMAYAIAADQALLDRDSTVATEQNELYNAADEKAVSLAASFPSAIAVPIKSAFEESQKTVKAAYDEARSQASTADAFIRDYLGSSDK